MKAKKRIFILIFTVIIALCTAVFSGCESYSEMWKISRDGNYRFITEETIVANGKCTDISRVITEAFDWRFRKRKVKTSLEAFSLEDDGINFMCVLSFDDDETNYYTAFGFIDFKARNRVSIYKIAEDGFKYSASIFFGDNSVLFKNKNGYQIFDFSTKEINPWETPAETAECKLLHFYSADNYKYLVAKYRNEEESLNKFYITDGSGFKKAITVKDEEDCYIGGIKNGYLFYRNNSDDELTFAVNLDSGERLSTDDALKLYNKNLNKFVIDGKEYSYDFGEDSLSITHGDDVKTFTMSTIRETVPQVEQCEALYDKGKLALYRVILQNGEFYLELRSKPYFAAGIGYMFLNVCPPIVLRYNPYNGSFSYIGFHPERDYKYSLLSIQKL